MGAGEVRPEEKSGIDRILNRWPMLPLASLSFWIAWRFIAFSGTMSISLGAQDLVFYLTLLAVGILAMAAPRLAERALKLPTGIFGLVAMAGTLLLLVPGPEGANFTPLVRSAAFGAGSFLSGVGITFIAVKSCLLLGRLRPTEIWIWLAYTEFVVVAIYFVILGTEGPIAAVIFALLPLLAGLSAGLGNRAGAVPSTPSPEDAPPVSLAAYAKFGAFVLLLSITCYMARLLAINPINDPFSTNMLAWPALGRVLIALAILGGVVYFSRRFPFSKMCVFVVIVILVVLACTTLPSFDNFWLFTLTAFAHPVLECMTLAIAACLIYRTPRQGVRIAGLALAALYGMTPLAEFVGWVINAVYPEALNTVFLLVVIACAADSLLFLQDKTYESAMGAVEKPRAVVSKGKQRRLQQAEVLRDKMNLSQREFDVVVEIQRGQSAQKIAEHMNLSVHTVRGHIQNIYAKCGAHSRDELIDMMNNLEL